MANKTDRKAERDGSSRLDVNSIHHHYQSYYFCRKHFQGSKVLEQAIMKFPISRTVTKRCLGNNIEENAKPALLHRTVPDTKLEYRIYSDLHSLTRCYTFY